MTVPTIEGLERRLDAIVEAARRREEHRLALANASPADHAARMAVVRSELASWRSQATAGALRSAAKGATT